jgi:hypothetical protein
MLRIPHCVDNGLTYGDKVISPTRRPRFNPKKIPGTHFCWSKPQDLGRLKGLRKSKNSISSSGIEPATFRPVEQSLNLLPCPHAKRRLLPSEFIQDLMRTQSSPRLSDKTSQAVPQLTSADGI